MRYHAFETEDGTATKLTDKVPVRRIRPRPPANPLNFLPSLAVGDLLEFSLEVPCNRRVTAA